MVFQFKSGHTCLLHACHNQVTFIYFAIQLQNNVDDSEVDDVKDDEEEEYKEPKNSSAIALVIVLIVLLVCVMAFGGAVWWTYGHGNQCPSILRGYEPVSESDTNNLMNEFPMSTHVP